MADWYDFNLTLEDDTGRWAAETFVPAETYREMVGDEQVVLEIDDVDVSIDDEGTVVMVLVDGRSRYDSIDRWIADRRNQYPDDYIHGAVKVWHPL